MNAISYPQEALANLISKAQARPLSITTKKAFEPHYGVSLKDYQGNHQNWTDGGFTNHH